MALVVSEIARSPTDFSTAGTLITVLAAEDVAGVAISYTTGCGQRMACTSSIATGCVADVLEPPDWKSQMTSAEADDMAPLSMERASFCVAEGVSKGISGALRNAFSAVTGRGVGSSSGSCSRGARLSSLDRPERPPS